MSRQATAILAIAGSDPSGGAGIQADLKTLSVLKVYGAAAVTCLTVQNTLGVLSCHPVAPELVYQQIVAVLSDLCVSHIKIGMVGSTAVAQAISQALQGFQGEIIYDPIVFSSVGQPVRTTDGLDGIRQLASQATVLTPNLHELQLLSSAPCTDTDQALEASRELLRASPHLKALVLKGGHLDATSDTASDYLFTKDLDQPLARRHRRIVSLNTHGTGCTFASAFAAYHQRLNDYQQAFYQTVDFLDTLLSLSSRWRLGKGNGGLSHHLFHD